jgi:hypothetical protein
MLARIQNAARETQREEAEMWTKRGIGTFGAIVLLFVSTNVANGSKLEKTVAFETSAWASTETARVEIKSAEETIQNLAGCAGFTVFQPVGLGICAATLAAAEGVAATQQRSTGTCQLFRVQSPALVCPA